ncbi:MAG TPA: hypothetical protein VL995_15325 [Cellvibrio sp.]|nr:hypothetical protein [Cellvibrio sp.]
MVKIHMCIAVAFVASINAHAFTSGGEAGSSGGNKAVVLPELSASENGVNPTVNINFEIPLEGKHKVIAKAAISANQTTEDNADAIDVFSATSGNYLAGLEYYYNAKEYFVIGGSGFVTKWNYTIQSENTGDSGSALSNVESDLSIFELYAALKFKKQVSLSYVIRYADLLSDDEINEIEKNLDGEFSSKLKLQIALDQDQNSNSGYVSANLIMPYDGSEAIFTIGVEKGFDFLD